MTKTRSYTFWAQDNQLFGYWAFNSYTIIYDTPAYSLIRLKAVVLYISKLVMKSISLWVCELSMVSVLHNHDLSETERHEYLFWLSRLVSSYKDRGEARSQKPEAISNLLRYA